jgi:glucose-1-phosphate thymidylyltransferase
MKVIIPLAGRGTRLRPHTHSKPKPLIKVAGKAVLGHILDTLKGLAIEEIIFITGAMQEQIEDFVSSHYKYRTTYMQQEELLGDGYAINLAKNLVKGDVLIIFVDTIFKGDLSVINKLKEEGIVWVKQTKTPERFGVVVLDKDKNITKIVEKPKTFVSNLAVIGLYYFKDSTKMFSYLNKIIKKKKTSSGGEYRLADAIELMITDGIKLQAREVDVWADCGKPETLLSTNRYLLNHGHERTAPTKNSVIIPPVYIGEEVTVVNSIIGPHVSIAKKCVIINSIIKDSIIDQNSIIENSALNKSLIGDSALIKDTFRKVNVGDNSEIDLSE